MPGTSVTSHGDAFAGSVVGSWSGCDSTAGNQCTVALGSFASGADRLVTASFEPEPPAPPGGGPVTPPPTKKKCKKGQKLKKGKCVKKKQQEEEEDAPAPPSRPPRIPAVIDREQVLHVARLARLQLTDEEVERMSAELAASSSTSSASPRSTSTTSSPPRT